MPCPRGLFAILAALAWVLFAGVARGDVRGVAARVEEQWRVAGARAVTLPPRFVFDDEAIVVPVPEDSDERACIHVAVVGARGLGFRARLSGAPTDPLLAPEPAARAVSRAGVLELRRCGRERRVRHVVVTAESGRGTVEIVVGRADEPLASLSSILPERTGGVLQRPANAGALPPLSSQRARVEHAENRARREGATVDVRTVTRAGDDGAGERELLLGEGCHRIEVFGHEAPRSRFRLDVDAELRDGESLLARDRTEAADARLETCVGGAARASLIFAGAPPRTDVVVTRARWALPAKLPRAWGDFVRGKMGRVMLLRHVAPTDAPVALAQGGPGATPVPLSVETGACYVAVVGMTHGRVRQLQLRAFVGARESSDERGAADEAALVAFCVQAHEPVRLEVLARGAGLSWALALYRVKSGVWEAGR